MSAIATVQAVIQWAIEGHNGPPPQGDARAIDALCAPPAELSESLRVLTTKTAAQLYVSLPFLGDPRPVHGDALVLANAIGVSLINERLAANVLRGVEANPLSKTDWLARHTLITPALFHLHAKYDELDGIFRDYSPLTGLLSYPTEQQRPAIIDIALQMLEQRERFHAEYTMLVIHLARPTKEKAVRDWRTSLLKHLRLRDPEFVIDVYEVTIINYKEDALKQIQHARNVFSDPTLANVDALLEDAISIADWWGPLYALNRAEVDRLRRRRYLDYDYLEGTDLYSRRLRIAGG